MVVTSPESGIKTKNPPPPMFPAVGCVTAKANAVATAASIAFPPFFRISIPTCDATDLEENTIPFGATTCAKQKELIEENIITLSNKELPFIIFNINTLL
jgi:hypothetical protein